jgi:hypothetical protein
MPVIPTEASRRFFFNFAPVKLSACEVEESLFDSSRKPSQIKKARAKNLPEPIIF